MTGTQILTAAQALYNEETGDFIPTTYLQARLNEIKARVEVRTRVYRVTNTQALTDSTRTYQLPAGWFALRRRIGVRVTGVGPLRPTTIDDLVEAYPLTWDTAESGQPTHYYLDEAMMTAAPGVTNVALGLYPTPSATVASGLKLSGYGLSADFSTYSEAVAWPTPFHFVLVWGLCKAAAIRDSDPELKVARKLSMWESEYERAIAEMVQGVSDFEITGASVQIGGGAGGVRDDTDVLMVINT